MNETRTNDFLEKEHLGKLMRKYTIPCVVSLLVAALYNIVDQIFIAKCKLSRILRKCGQYSCLSAYCRCAGNCNDNRRWVLYLRQHQPWRKRKAECSSGHRKRCFECDCCGYHSNADLSGFSGSDPDHVRRESE